ncbi:MAG: cytochrome c [Terracidiphilus sp.]
MVKALLGVVVGVLLVPLVVVGWLWLGKPPVAVADPPLPQERQLTGVPLHKRIAREMPKSAPLNADEETLVAGAQIYRDQCAVCHGFHGRPSAIGGRIFPDAPPLWEKHPHGDVVGVSDDPPGETYWKVVNGIRLTGMPAYKGLLTEAQMWQVSLLLANADKPLPPAAVDILRGEPAPAAPAPVTPVPAAKKKPATAGKE